MGHASVLLSIAVCFIVVLVPKLVNGVECPNFPKQLSLNCAPHSTVDQCKFDADCRESKDHKCCLIGCQKMCLDPSLIEMSIQGASVCPVLPRPSSCPNKPNECSDQSECSDGRKCCSDGCRMVCAAPVVVPTTATPKTFPWKSCNASVDVAFIIDSSGSINRRNYVKIKAFVKNIARSFGISPSESQASIVLYSTKASVKAHFGQYPTTEEFVKAVDGLPHERGYTFINLALRLAASEVFPRARKNVPKIAMLLTDGKQTDPTGTVNLREASAPLRNQGVRVIVFGVGKSINVRELRLTVERDEDVITVMKFDDLTTKVREYTASLCQAAETEPIHPDADIIFLIDSSTGVSSQQFDTEKQFVRRMVRYFIVSPLGPRAAFVTYATTSYTVIGFSGYSSTADFSLQINRAPFLGGRRRIDQALIHAAKMFRETGRIGLRIVIILTAGNYYMGPGARSTSFVSSQLRSLDAHMYVIGIGPYFTPSMFTPMVRGPSDIFEVPSFKDLTPWQSKIARQLRMSTNAFKYERAYWRADVIFLMDSSRYVTANNYILEKNFVKLMARLLNLANNRSRMALFTFSDNPQLEIAFDGYQDREAFDAAVNKAPQLEGNRRIDKAFQSAAELLRTKSRASVPKYVILLTTGKQTRQSDTRSLADTSRNLRSYDTRVFVVAILTGGYTIRDFYTAVQRPEDAFSVASFTDLLPRAPSMAARVMASWRAPAKPNFAADIVFIVDSSSYVSPFQYTRSKRFIRILSDYLNVAPGKSRGAMVTFGETPVVVFSFDSYKLLSEFRTQVNDAPYLGGEPSISTTLSAAGTLFSDARGSYPWIAILLTSWRPDDPQDSRRLEVLARPLLSRGVWLYVLSIGENPYVGWLRPMLVEPRDAFSVVSYRDLPGNVGPLASYIVNDNYIYGDSSFQVDILFLMDTSEGVNLQDYKIEKRFIQRIALHLGIFSGRSRGALVAYGANSLVVFGFGGYNSNSEFVRRVNDAPMFGGDRRVDRALDTAAALMLGARSTMPKVVVLIMAGQHSADPDAMSIKDAARPLRQLGAWLYVMAIGPIDLRELQKATITSTDVFFARSFSGLLGYITPMARYIANTSVIAGTSPLNADIVFAIDCSSSVPYREYSTEKSFVRSLAQYLNIQQSQSRAALAVYGGRVFTLIRLERSQSFFRFDSALTRAPYLGGLRRYDKALDIARDIFANARKNIPRVMLLFMAGSQTQATGAKSLQDAVKPLRQQGITTFIFRIGSEPGQRELLSAVDRPGNLVTFSSFADMDARVPYVARQIPFYSALLGPPSFAVDVVYLIDSSDPVTQDQYGDQKEFVKYLARYLNTMPSRTRGAVITYGSSATLVTNLGMANTTQAFDMAVDSAAKVGGERRMDRAVDAARGVFLSKARPAFAKVAILLTSGHQLAEIQHSVLKAAFQRLYDLGARLYAVTIDIPAISLPLADWFPVRSFRDLPIQVLPLARHAALDTASLGPNKFVADVIFMLDSSSRVTPEDFLKEKEFVKLIARYLNITPGKSRGSVIIFSTAANAILPFSGYTTMSEFNAVIDRASQLSGNRRLDRAFGVAATLFQNARTDVLKIAIVLTGGMQSPEGGSLQEAMKPLRNMQVVTYVIAVGAPSDVPVESSEDIFMVTSYGDLPGEVQQIARNISKRRAPVTPLAKITTTPTPTTAAEPTTTPKETQTPTAPKGTTPATATPADPCETEGCNAPYSIGCRAVNNQARCICPKCPVVRRPVCASDGVQDLSECLMKKQACEGDVNVTVAKEGPCDKECRAFLDIAFIIDSSGSIGRWNWERMKRFVKSIVSNLDVSSSTTRIAVIAYSTNPEVVILFRNFQGTDMVNRVIDNMRWQRGFTYTDKALLLAERSLFQTSNGMRVNVPKLAVVITDGRQTTTGQYTELSVASRGIKTKGVTLYAVGVGIGADRAELEEIASRPEYVLMSSSFEELQSTSSGMIRRLCEGATPIPTTTPTPTPNQTTPVPDPCEIKGCSAPYNIGCRVVDSRAQCICPTCRDFRKPVCASDGVQDLTECHLKRQACEADMNVTVAKQEPCDKVCSDVMDIAFLIDSSGSVGRTNWVRMKRFVKSVISSLDVSSSTTRIAAIAYSTNPKTVWKFIDFQGTDMLNRALDQMVWQRGYTYIDKALLLADRSLFQTLNGMRLKVPKFAVVITDGEQTTTGPYTRLSVSSRGMKNKGVTVYAVGIGSGAKKAELDEIASGPEFVLTSSSFEDLPLASRLLTRGLCEVPTTTATPKETPTPTARETTKKVTATNPDLCQTQGCTAPYNIGCQVVENKAECICPTCPIVRRPVCASDDVQDLTECHLKQQSCLADMDVTVAKQGPCDKECSLVVDIAFIIDSSGSIGRKNWERMKRFVKSIVSKLDVRSSATHIAAIAYSSNPQVVMLFRYFQGTDEVNRLFDRMRWQRGYTYTDKALLLADSRLFQTSNGMRPGARKLAVVITDGKQTTTEQYTRLSVASRGVKNKGATVYAVGVGSGADQEELEEIASKPEYVFISSSFRDLQNVSKIMTRLLCEKATPTPREIPTTTPKETTPLPTTAEPTTTTTTTTASKITQTTTVPKATTPAPTIPDPCKTEGCNAPHNIGCQVVNNRAQCICPSCSNIRRPICASDGVQDLSECHLRQQACLADMLVTVAKPGPCGKECSLVVDIAFIIDSSGSIGRKNWELMKRFVKSIVSKLDVRSSATRVAAIAYSTNPQVVMLFRYSQGTDEINRVFDRMRWQRGYTYTDKALLLADSRLFQTLNGMRPGVKKLAVVITDGKQTTTGQYTKLSVASRGVKNKGATVYAVGVGSGADQEELEEIASNPEYVFISSSFRDLQNVSKVITRLLCDKVTPIPRDVPTTTPKEKWPPTTADLTGPTTTTKVTQTTTVPRATTPAPTIPDPCKTEGCNAPYNIGCQVANNRAQCICPSCSNVRRPVCASDGVQDLSECHLRQQACQADMLVTVAKTGPCAKECQSEVDIAFIIDSSGSIGRKNWERMKRFVKSIVSKLDVRSSAARIAAIAYSTNPQVVMLFRYVQGTDEVNRLFDRMRWQRGYTYTDKALLLADSRLFQTSNGMSPGARKIAVVITDGAQTKTGSYTRLSVASQGVKDKGVTVYAVGIGSGTDKAELAEISSGPEYVLTSLSFKDLQSVSLRLRRELCQESTTTTRTQTTSGPKVTTPEQTTAEPTTTTQTPKVTQTSTAPVTTTAPTTPDPCKTEGCNAPYNIGCRVVNNRAQCICPSCPNTRNPVCASDGVQDMNECHLKQQACLGDITLTVARQGSCDKECRSIVDIAFIIDSSGSIGRRNWERMKRFVKSVVTKLYVSPSATQVAIIAYSTNPIVEMRFWNTQNTNDVNQLIDNIPWQRGYTYTDKALQLADSDLFQTRNGMRVNVPKLAVVITDGKQTKNARYTRLSAASRGIKDKGVTVYAVGVGSGVDKEELREIASESQNVLTSSSFKDLQNISLGLTKRLCAVPTPMVKGTLSSTPKLTTPVPTRPDPCQTVGCSAPYNIGCRVVNHQAQCVCPTCPITRNPVCSSDGVQDLSECYLRRQACLGDIAVTVVRQGPCARGCFSVVDIAFIMDSSGSIGRRNWEKLKRFVKSIVSRFDVGFSATHVAVIAYSTNPVVEMRFWNTQSTDEVNQVIDKIPWQRGMTYSNKALLLADRDIFTIANGMRPEAPKLAVVITDGPQTTGRHTDLSVASQGIKSKGINVFAVGVGSAVPQKELEEMASGSSNVYRPRSFENLLDLSPKITKSLCDAVPSPPTPSFIPTTTLKVTTTPTTPDPCQIERCTALYSIGCQVVGNKAQCICPSCPNITDPVCASDDVQDLSECHMKQQACQGHITAFVEKEGPCAKECRSLVDIAFIIDSSGSIGRRNWEKMKRFLKAVVSKLEVSSSATHVAAVAYSTTPEVVMRFSDEQDTDQVNRVFDGMPWQRGITRIDEALLMADKDLFQTSNGMRPSVAKIAIVITDGKQTTTRDYTRLSKASEGIKGKDVTVYAVGVGTNVDEDELKEIATSPDYVLTSNSFTALQTIAPQIRKAVCDDPKVKFSADVLFIMDSSSDTISTYNTAKDLVKRLARYLNINPEGTRSALAVFNGRPRMITDFESFRSTSDFESAVDKAPHLGGNRSVSVALRSAGKMFDSPSSVSKVIFLVTSGRPLDNEDGSSAGDVIDKLSSLGVRTYVVLLGPINNPGKFRSMVEDPENVFAIDSQEDISKKINQVGSHVITDSVTPKEKNLTMYVLFIVDSSTDVSASNFTEEKELIKSLISELNINPANSGSRVGIMAYSNEATMILDFQNRENKSSLEEIIDNIPQLPGPRRIDNALKAAVNAFEVVETDSPRFVVLLAAGQQTDEAGSDSFSAAVRPLHHSGTKTHVMAIGDDVDPDYFQAEDQEKTNVLSVPTFSDLPQSASRLAGDLVNDYVSQKDPARPTGSTVKLTTTRPTTVTKASNKPSTTTEPGTTSSSPDDKVESSSPLDIVFLIDTSDGVTQSDLRQQKEFVKLVGQRLRVSPTHSHAAVLGYSDQPRLSGGFYSHLRGESFQEVADSVTLSGGKRNIQEALRQAKTMLNMGRPAVPRVVFLITYGQQAPDFGFPQLQQTAQSLRDMGADLYVIGVGVDESDPQLQKVVKRPNEFFKIPTSSDLQSYAQLIAYYATSGLGINVSPNYKVEVVYVLDSSSTVGPENYKLLKDFTKALARVLNHSPNYTQSAVITFGSFPYTPIRMGSHRDLETFSQAVDNLRYLGGNSNLDIAVTFAARAFSSDDPKVPNIIIVVSNKDPSSRESVDMLAGTLRREGKIVNVIGVGNETDFPNLRRLAGRSDNMFTPKSFSDLMSYAPRVASNILADTLPPTTPSTASTTTSKVTTTTTVFEEYTPSPAASTSRITPSLANREKPGLCPYIPRPPSCSSRSRQCNYDNECTGDLKCCDNGCGKICVSTSYTSPTVEALQANRCPSYPPNRQCSSLVQDECTCHSDCDQYNSYKCCFDGCRRLCSKTEARIQCVRGVDIAFLMDSSESITEEDFKREKTAVKEIAGSFLNASRDSRAGVIMYSGQAELSVDFVGQSQFKFFSSAVDALAHRRSMTRIDRALRYASNTLFANPRPSITSIAVVMTDGVQTPDPGLEPLGQAVAPLHSKGVRVLAVGVGPRVNRNELRELVKREEDVFQMSSFEDLLNKSAQLLETVCPQLPTSRTTTPITTTRLPPSTPRITTTASIELDPKCDKLFDAIFVMDSSQSINALQYGREKEFVKELATIINVGAGSRAAVIIYSDRTQLKIQFDQHSNLDSFKLAVDALPYLQQRTRIDKALYLAAQTLNQARTGIPKAVIIMTDGRQTQEPDAVPLDVVADAIRRKGARLLVVGVGPKFSESGLMEIAADRSNLFIVQTFENLGKATRDVITSACNETEIPTIPEITTTPTPDARSCPPLTEPPFGFCSSNVSTCFGDESCRYGKCCYDGCRFSCTSLGGIASRCVEAFDLGFAMDSSGSIRDANYKKEKDFIKGLADQLDVGLQTVQLGLIVFSDVPFLLIRFGTLKSIDLTSFADVVDEVPYFRGRTRIDSALETAANNMFPEGRQNSVPQVFFLVTDGRQSRDPGAVALDQAVRPLQEKGIKVIVVGIGDDVDKDELRSLVENPNDDAFFVSSFDDLKGLLDEKRLVDALCISKRRRL